MTTLKKNSSVRIMSTKGNVTGYGTVNSVDKEKAKVEITTTTDKVRTIPLARVESITKAELDAVIAKQQADAERRAAPSKRELCAKVYNRLKAKDAPRKEIIAEFISEVGMTNNGAATYYQKFLSSEWA